MRWLTVNGTSGARRHHKWINDMHSFWIFLLNELKICCNSHECVCLICSITLPPAWAGSSATLPAGQHTTPGQILFSKKYLAGKCLSELWRQMQDIICLYHSECSFNFYSMKCRCRLCDLLKAMQLLLKRYHHVLLSSLLRFFLMKYAKQWSSP